MTSGCISVFAKSTCLYCGRREIPVANYPLNADFVGGGRGARGGADVTNLWCKWFHSKWHQSQSNFGGGRVNWCLKCRRWWNTK